MDAIKALTFDTGGTVLDWHTGIRDALARAGARHGLERDWSTITNDYRRRSLQRMLNAGAVGQPAAYNIDDVHREMLDVVAAEHGLEAFTHEDRQSIWLAWRNLGAWPDFPEALARLRRKYVVASFTILTTSLVIAVSRRNGLAWDAVISCEMMGVYKVRPEAYRTAARWLALEPSEILMVACHNFDLLAARAEGFRSAFVHRPDEWGPGGPPDPEPNSAHDIVVGSFGALAGRLGT